MTITGSVLRTYEVYLLGSQRAFSGNYLWFRMQIWNHETLTWFIFEEAALWLQCNGFEKNRILSFDKRLYGVRQNISRTRWKKQLYLPPSSFNDFVQEEL